MAEKENSKLTVKLFYDTLKTRVSSQTAKLILDSALSPMGMTSESQEYELTNDQAKDLCLQMIKKGGPAFNVGQTIYRNHLQ
jgi:hypothetical protein